MTQEEKMNIVAALTKSGKVEIGQFVVENNGTMNYNQAGASAAEQPETMPDGDALAKAIGKVKALLWGNSSYAVLYCVCRDKYGVNNRSEWERMIALLPNPSSHRCTPGVVSSTINDNKWMELPIKKWKENNAPERVMKLVEGFKTSLEEVTETT